jgi:hypothetical protein
MGISKLQIQRKAKSNSERLHFLLCKIFSPGPQRYWPITFSEIDDGNALSQALKDDYSLLLGFKK